MVRLEVDTASIVNAPFLVLKLIDLGIDLGLEKFIAAERQCIKIPVEIKSFLGLFKITEFYKALGQFIAYRTALRSQEANRTLYPAVSSDIYERFFITPFI